MRCSPPENRRVRNTGEVHSRRRREAILSASEQRTRNEQASGSSPLVGTFKPAKISRIRAMLGTLAALFILVLLTATAAAGSRRIDTSPTGRVGQLFVASAAVLFVPFMLY